MFRRPFNHDRDLFWKEPDMAPYKHSNIPQAGAKITVEKGALQVPERPIIPYIEGDGIGPDIWCATQRVVDAAVAEAYQRERSIAWMEVLAGEKAFQKTGEWLPEETFEAMREFRVAIKGPLTTPVGGGIRSLNVTIRQVLDLYSCVRPVRWIKGMPSPMKEPDRLDVVIFRENTEDLYAGIEWASGTKEAEKVRDFLVKEMGVTNIRELAGIGIKPMSPSGSKRHIAASIRYAIDHEHDTVTLVHKGNIMKYTEGAFRDWGYEVAKERFRDDIVTEEETWEGKSAEGKILVNDRITDSVFQQVMLRPEEYEVLTTPNLSGDFLSDACAAQIGGIGMAPGANVGDEVACFEATHGTAPKYAGKDMVNPGSLILSAVMMLEHLGWEEAAELVVKGVEGAVGVKQVTYDLERQMVGATKVSTSGFAESVIAHMGS